MVEQKTSFLEVYISPENSKYYEPKHFEDLELEVTSQGVNDLSLCLCGDFNARTPQRFVITYLTIIILLTMAIVKYLTLGSNHSCQGKIK